MKYKIKKVEFIRDKAVIYCEDNNTFSCSAEDGMEVIMMEELTVIKGEKDERHN